MTVGNFDVENTDWYHWMLRSRKSQDSFCNLNELIQKWGKAKSRNETDALNHLISSELFNFSSITINQKALENKHNELRVPLCFLLFETSLFFLPSKRNEAWKNWLDRKHNENPCLQLVWTKKEKSNWSCLNWQWFAKFR